MKGEIKMTKRMKSALVSRLCKETEAIYWSLQNRNTDQAATHRANRENIEAEIRKLCYVKKVWDINDMVAETDAALANILKPS